MDHTGNAANSLAGAAYRDESAEIRPLEEITGIADEVSRLNGVLDAYLGRFNGPPPAQLGSKAEVTPRPPTCYRFEIERLRGNVSEAGHLIDALVRLG